MWAALAIVLLIIPAPDGVIRDHVDVVEINTVYGATGYVFDQVVWWEWSSWDANYHVVDWRMLKDVRECTKIEPDGWNTPGEWIGGHACPQRRGNSYLSRWFDDKDKVRREVEASVYRRTHTTYDPEVEDREVLPVEHRRGLTKPVKRHGGGS